MKKLTKKELEAVKADILFQRFRIDTEPVRRIRVCRKCGKEVNSQNTDAIQKGKTILVKHECGLELTDGEWFVREDKEKEEKEEINRMYG